MAPPCPVTVILLTGVVCPLIVMLALPDIFDPSVAVALTVTIPLSIAVKIPDVAFMVAKADPLVIDQVTVLFVALAGSTVATI